MTNHLSLTFAFIFALGGLSASSMDLLESMLIEKAEIIVGQDYPSLLNGLNELRTESRKASNSTERKAIAVAMDELITEFVSGPYAIFDRRATITSGKSALGQSARSFLNRYPDKNFAAAKIHVVDTQVSSDRASVQVTFEASGETSTASVIRVAVLSISSQGKAKITEIRNLYAPRTKSDGETVAKGATKTEPVATTKASTIEVVQLPEIELKDILKSNTGRIRLDGQILRPVQNARLVATLNGVKLPAEQIILQEDKFSILPSTITTEDFEIELSYRYGDKFVSVRKHVILASK